MTRRDLWGGRFKQAPSDLLRQFNDSFSFDRELIAEDVQGSIAWAEALGRAGTLGKSEVRRVVAALKLIREDPPDADDGHEDVHSFVEQVLRKRVGLLADKLHTGRSRNDQVATDLKLYLKKALQEASTLALDVTDALIERAAEEAGTAMPGYTHLKRAEPVTFGHWCLAYVEMLLRDVDRLRDSQRRGDECPLGSGALSGTPLPVDRNLLARSLGFQRPSANSVDAVSDRDTAIEYIFDGTLLLSHLSRLAEDVILYSSDECRFIELPDSLTTGSSRMPQKKNPDLLELVRGHAARTIGDLTGILTLMKGLPLAYNKDLQLDKEPVFRLQQTLRLALPAVSAIIRQMKIDRERMREAASNDLMLATALTDALARRGVPFRHAHDIVGRRVAEAIASGRTLSQLGSSDQIETGDLQMLHVERAIAGRKAHGGTAPARVKQAVTAARKRSQKIRRELS